MLKIERQSALSLLPALLCACAPQEAAPPEEAALSAIASTLTMEEAEGIVMQVAALEGSPLSQADLTLDEVAACISLPAEPSWQESDCDAVRGWGFQVEFSDCPLGNQAISGSLTYSFGNLLNVAEGAADAWVTLAWLADMAALAAGEVDMAFALELDDPGGAGAGACGDFAGDARGSDSAGSFDIEATGGAVLLGEWDASDARIPMEEDVLRLRDASLALLLERADGSSVEAELAMVGVARLMADPYPYGGSLEAGCDGGSISLVFSSATPRTGQATLLLPDGTSRTVWLPLSDAS